MGTHLIAQALERLPSLKFLMVGAFCALLNVVIQYVSVELLGLHYVAGILLSFAVLVPLSFVLHKNMTFRVQGKLSWQRFALYTAQWIVMLALNIAVMALLLEMLHLPYAVALALGTLIGTALSYGASRFVFRPPG